LFAEKVISTLCTECIKEKVFKNAKKLKLSRYLFQLQQTFTCWYYFTQQF